MDTSVLTAKDCFVTTITLAAINKLGLESLEWDPLVLRDAFQAEFGIDALPARACDKLNCGYMLIGTNAFNSTIEGFLSGVKIMNRQLFTEGVIPFCDIAQCAWGIYEYQELIGKSNPDDKADTWSSDIIKYIQEAGNLNGLSVFPDFMKFAEPRNTMPDTTGDAQLFEMYLQRQEEYNGYIQNIISIKTNELESQLQLLVKEHIIQPK